MPPPTIPELIALVPPGQERTFPRQIEPTGAEGRFRIVNSSFESGNKPYALKWAQAPEAWLRPRPATRGLSAISLASVDDPQMKFDGRPSELADFYHVDVSLYVLSPKTFGVLKELDPAAVESRPVKVKILDGAGGAELYWAVVPTRVLEATDLSRTSMVVKHDEFLPGQFNYKVHAADGYTLIDDVPSDVHAFVQDWSADWLWSEQLLAGCEAGGVTGLEARHPSGLQTKPTLYL
jgi:hypothetical protein